MPPFYKRREFGYNYIAILFILLYTQYRFTAYSGGIMPHIRDFEGKNVHMIGIGGSSMSGLAGMLRQRGIHVTGSDNARSYMTESLEKQGIPVTIGHRPENVHGADLVVFSAAISETNPERMEATRLEIPQMERSVLLGQLMEGYEHSINVCGTHGKTTTTSMIAEVLVENHTDPTVHIGGQLDYIGGSTRVGSHKLFVVEACEYHKSFLEFHPTIAVITNIEEDHLDYYRDIDDIYHAFEDFTSLLPENGVCIGYGDDPLVSRLLSTQKCRIVSFGISSDCTWSPRGLHYDVTGCADFDVARNGQVVTHVTLKIPGLYNVLHALATIAACTEVGISPDDVAHALNAFTAPHRRFEHTGDVCGVALYTDYGHNPAEMHSALQNAAMQPHGTLFAVVQPHTYSRLKTLFKDYIHCCDLADEILVTDIYAARETDPGDIHSTMLVDAIAATGQNVHYTPTFDDAEAYLRAHWKPGDLVITMSCGDIHLLNAQIQKHGDDYKPEAK